MMNGYDEPHIRPRCSVVPTGLDWGRVSKKLFGIYAVFGTVQYFPKGIGHTAEGHQPIEQDGVIMTGNKTRLTYRSAGAVNMTGHWGY
jgi:hypothetical protein